MANKKTLEECPNCGQNLSNALARYFWNQLPGNYFEYECLGCHAILEIEVEPQPIYWVTLKTAQ
jgi:hypothetical protein